MLILVLFLFIPFISIIFGGTTLSLYFRKKGIDYDNKLYLKFAKDIIDLLTINKSMGIILGIVPLLTSVLVFAQLLHSAEHSIITYLVIVFFLVSISLVLIYTYRYSLSFKNILDFIKDDDSEDPSFKQEVEKFRRGSFNLSMKSGKYGLLILFFALWLFITAITLANYPDEWGSQNLFFLLFSWKVLVKFIHFIATAFAITGAALLFAFFYWEGGKKGLNDVYKEFVRNISLKITFTAALLQPLFLLINLFAIPGDALSSSVFTYSFIALILLFLAYHYLYDMIKNSYVKFSGQVFYVILFSLLALIIKDQLAMSNVTKKQKAVLVSEFEKYMSELKGKGEGAAKINGEELYKVRCEACHRFDTKLVGPPHNQVLPKYEGKKEQLVAFIRNPVKVDPLYPPMPNPGLKPQEAEAIVTYMLEHFKQGKGK
jgi:cytochrome c